MALRLHGAINFITNPVKPTASSPAVSKRFLFVIARIPRSVLNGRSKFKHLFEKKTRREPGKSVTFWVPRFSRHTAGGQCKRSGKACSRLPVSPPVSAATAIGPDTICARYVVAGCEQMVETLYGNKFFDEWSTEGGATCGPAGGSAVTPVSVLSFGAEAVCRSI